MNIRRYGIRFIKYPLVIIFLFAILLVVFFQKQPLQEHHAVFHTAQNVAQDNKVILNHFKVQFEDHERTFPVAIVDEHQEGIYTDKTFCSYHKQINGFL